MIKSSLNFSAQRWWVKIEIEFYNFIDAVTVNKSHL